MTVGSGPHLGARVSALVDGRLRPDATARAESHLRTCRACAGAVEAERLVKARLHSLDGPAPSDDLLIRLRALGGPVGPLRPREQPMAGAPSRPSAAPPRAWDVSVRPAGRHPGGRRPGRRRAVRVRRPLTVVLLGAFSLIGAGLTGAVLLAGTDGPPSLPIAELSWWQQPAVDVRPTGAPSPVTVTPSSAPVGAGRP